MSLAEPSLSMHQSDFTDDLCEDTWMKKNKDILIVKSLYQGIFPIIFE
jgi:hypothetical protein